MKKHTTPPFWRSNHKGIFVILLFFVFSFFSAYFLPVAHAAAAPTITSVTPTSGFIGDSFTITGTNFFAGTIVMVNGTQASDAIIASSTTITATLPANSYGKADITVTDTANQSATLVGAVTYTDAYHVINKWKGTTSVDWNTATNWTQARIPNDTDVVVIDGNGTYAPRLTLTGPLTLQALSVGATTASTLTLVANNDTNTLGLLGPSSIGKVGNIISSTNTASTNNKLYLTSNDNFSIASGGKLAADNAGYPASSGPGGASTAAGGAAHGGYGSNGKAPYGSITQPVDWGSTGSSGNAGGALRLIASSNLRVDGIISANGVSGSGGSVWVTVSGNLSGLASGTFAANHTSTAASSGGRVAIYAADFTGFLGKKQAYGSSGAGTIYTKTPYQAYGDLLIDNNTKDAGGYSTPEMLTNATYDNLQVTNGGRYLIPATSTTTILAAPLAAAGSTVTQRGVVRVDGAINLPGSTPYNNYYMILNGSYSDKNPVVGSGTTIELQNTNNTTAWNLDSLAIRSGGAVTTGTNTTAPDRTLNLNVSGDLTIDTGGTITATGKGYGANSGPGAGNGPTYIGAVHGGQASNNTKAPYGSIREPVDMGSGGNQPGGGAIRINVTGALAANGTITANGGGDGGAGGSIWVTANTISGPGAINANGLAGFYGRGTSGGRVALYANSSTHTGAKTAYGGFYNSGAAGAAGTVYTKFGSQVNGDLLVDNNGNDPLLVTPEMSSLTTYDTIKVSGAARYYIAPSQTVNAGALLPGASAGAADRGFLFDYGTLNVPNNHTITNLWLVINGVYSDKNPVIGAGAVAEVNNINNFTAWSLDTLTVRSGGTVTTGANTTAPDRTLNINVSGDITVDSGGYISQNGKGYGANTGPGAGNSTTYIGAVHGGQAPNNTKTPYGSIREPVDMGSGGNQPGGGVIRLNATGKITANGIITANAGGDGGAGGSIWLSASSLVGAGTISANGLAGYYGRGSSGGRVALYANSSTFTGAKTAYAGVYNGTAGAAGTVYTKFGSQVNGDLIIDNNNNDGPLYTPEMSSLVTYDNIQATKAGRYAISSNQIVNTGALQPGFGSSATDRGYIHDSGTLNVPNNHTVANLWLYINGTYSDQNPIIGGGGTIEHLLMSPSYIWSLSTLTVRSGGGLTVPANTTTAEHTINLATTGDITVDSGGNITTAGKGYGVNSGPGAGNSASSIGAIYGGQVSNNTKAPYGSIREPVDMGSGANATGGGAIRINTQSTITLNGTISSNAGGDGGSGGSVWLSSDTLAGAGSITANGQAGYNGRAASGGRIALYAANASFSGAKTAFGASYSGSTGAAGTVYTKFGAQSNGTLIVDNNSIDTGDTGTPEMSSPVTYDSLQATRMGVYIIPAGTETTVASNIINGGGVGTGRGVILLNGTLKTTNATTFVNYYVKHNGTYNPDKDLTIGAGTTYELQNTTSSSPWVLGINLTVASGGILTHPQNTNAETYTLNIATTETVTVASGGLIDVNNKGFSQGTGPGRGSATTEGAGYGGYGHGAVGGVSGDTYGSATEPTNIGSGGGSTTSGGTGGGAVKIEGAKGITVNGTIRADGNTNSYGSGSGGSIWLLGRAVGGTGAITAKGGGGSYPGGGGRIAFAYTSNFQINSPVMPNKGTGGDTVTITGTGISQNATVRFGKLVATYSYINSSQIQVTVPSRGIPGPVDVSVEQPSFLGTISVAAGGPTAGEGTTSPNPITQIKTLENAFSYIIAQPSITNVTPKTGPVDGGTRIKISGSNFLMPNTTANTWTNTGKVTGYGSSEGASIAVIGDKIYLYGGSYATRIWSANVSDPTTWTNTGKTLPTGTRWAQLHIIGQTMYLFTHNNILTASTTDPTTWTSTGKTIAAEGSSIVRVGDTLYKYGGSASRTAIQTASINDPTTWTTSSNTVPSGMSYAASTTIGSTIYFFGSYGAPANNLIWTASTNDPTLLTQASKTLPANIGIGSFAVIGEQLYLFGGSGSSNDIYTASINDPITWTNTGKTLPTARQSAALALIDDAVYLFEGYNSGGAIYKADILRTTEYDSYNPWWTTNWKNTAPSNAYARVTLSGLPATDVQVADSNTIYATTAAHVAGPVDVTVLQTDLQSVNLPVGSYRYVVPARIDDILPSYGATSGGDSITIKGANFVPSMTVSFGGITAETTYVNDTTLVAIAPPHPIGAVDISVTEPDVTPVTVPNGFQYVGAPPTIDSITPNVGPYTGGTRVTIKGTNLFTQYDRAVTVTNNSGSVLSGYPVRVSLNTKNLIDANKMRSDCGDLRVKASDKLTDYAYWIESGCNTATTQVWFKPGKLETGANTAYITYGNPSLEAGANGNLVFSFFDGFEQQDPNKWDFANAAGWSVNTADGKAVSSVTDSYLKTLATPNASALSATNGFAIGANLQNTSAMSPNDITVRATIGDTTYDIPHVTATSSSIYGFFDRICAGSGTCLTQPTKDANKYETTVLSGSQKAYINNAVNPFDSRTVSLTGSLNDISIAFRGAGLADYVYVRPLVATEPTTALSGGETATAPTVTFDGLNAPSVYTIPGRSEIYAITPSHTVGVVDVTIREPGHTPVTVRNGFTYVVPPDIQSITPSQGSSAGQNTVTIIGNNFSGSPVVTFAGVPATNIRIIDSHTIYATVPAGTPGPADVTVSYPETVSDTLVYGYTYLEDAPIVSGITPTRGSTLGGTNVTINGSGFYKRFLMPLTITNDSAELTDYQVPIVLDTASLIANGKMRADCGDLRIFASDKLAYRPYWIESGCNTTKTRIWTKLPVIASGANTIYIGYGNLNETSAQNGNAVFAFFDNFSTKDTAKWDYPGAWNITNGIVTSANPTSSWSTIRSTTPMALTLTNESGYALTTRLKNSGDVSPYNLASYLNIDGTLFGAPYLSNSSNTYSFFTHSCPSSTGCPTALTYNFATLESTIRNGEQNLYLNGSLIDTANATFTSGLITELQHSFNGNGSIDYTYIRKYSPTVLAQTFGEEAAQMPKITFDGLDATIASVTNSQLVVSTPAHVQATVDVKVANATSSTTTLPQSFTYYPKLFVYLNPPTSMRETEPVQVNFELRDEAGNPVSYSKNTVIQLSTDSTSGFFARDLNEAESTRWDYKSIVLPAGQSSGHFYYKNNIKGPASITATTELADGKLGTTWSFDVKSRYRLLVTGVTNPVASGLPSSVTIQAVDYTGTPLHDYTGTVHFSTGDAAAIVPKDTAITSAMRGGKTFTNGVTLVTQGQWCVTATDVNDPDITGEQCNINVTPPAEGNISKLAFITNPPLFAATSQSDAITVQFQDDKGTAIPAGATTSVYLYSSSGTGQFSLDGDTWHPSGYMISIRGGTTSSTFYYKDSTLGHPTITARDDEGSGPDYGLQNALMQATVGGGKAYRIGIQKPTAPLVANFPSGAFHVTVYDSLGNEALLTSSQTVWITSSSTTGIFSSTGQFDTDGTVRLPITIPAGQTGADFYYKDSATGIKTIYGSEVDPRNGDIGLIDGNVDVSLNGGTPTQFAFGSAPFQLVAGAVSDPITIELRDSIGNQTISSSDTTVYLSTDQPGGILLGLDGKTVINSVVIPAGQQSAQFKLKQSSYISSQTIVATDNPSGPDGDAGLKDVSQTEPIMSGDASSLVFIDPPSSNALAGTTTGPYKVGLQNQYGVTIPASNATPLYFKNSSPSGEFSLDGTTWSQSLTASLEPNTETISFYYRDTLADTHTITVADEPTGTDTGLKNATFELNLSAGVASRLAISTAAQTLEAGQTSSIMRVQLQDANGNAVTSATNQTFTVSSSSTGGQFDRSSTGSFASNTLSLTIPAGQSSVPFFYKDTVAGAAEISITSGSLATVSQTETIIWGNTASFAIEGPSPLAAGAVGGPFTVFSKNAYGVTVPSSATMNATLTSSHGSSGAFDTVADGSFGRNSLELVLSQGDQSATFYYKDAVSGNLTLSATAGTIKGTLHTTIKPGEATQISFITSPPSLMRGQASDPVQIEARDAFGNRTTVTELLSIELSTTSQDALFALTNGQSITTLSIPAGESEASFIYTDMLAGSPTVTATTSIGSAAQTFSITNGTPTGFVLSSPSGNTLKAGENKQMRVSSVNAYNVIVPTSVDIPVVLSSSNATGRFALQPTDAFNLDTLTVTIPASQTGADFYYKDTTSGSSVVSARHNNYTSADYTFNITAAEPASLRFASPERTTKAGATSSAITIGVNDVYGNATIPSSPVTITFSSSEPTSKVSSTTIAGTSNTTTLTLSAGSATIDGYYIDTVAGTKQLQISSPTLGSTTQPTVITANDFHHVGFSTAPQTIVVKNSSAPIKLSGFDRYNNPLNLPDMTIRLSSASANGEFSLSDSSWQPVTDLVITAGAQDSTFYYKDSRLADTVITATPSIAAAVSQPVHIIAGSAAKLLFTSPEQSVVINTPSQPIDITLADSNNYPAPSSDPVTVTLTSSSTTTEYSLNGIDGWSSTLTYTVQPGTTKQTIYFRDSTDGAVIMSSSSAELTGGSQNITVLTGVASKLSIATANTTGANIPIPVVIQTTTSEGYPASVSQTTTIPISGEHGGEYSLSDTNWQPVSSVTIPAGQYKATLYYRNTKAGTDTLSAASPNGMAWQSASTTIEIGAGNFTQFAFVPSNLNLNAGATSAPIAVQARDQYGNDVILATDQVVHLYGTSDSHFADNPDGPWNVSQVTIYAGSGSASIYYTDTMPGTKTITASDQTPLDTPDSGITNATANISVNSLPPSQLAFTSQQLTVVAGERSQEITIEARQADGSRAYLGDILTIQLTSSLGGAFYASPTSDTPITSVTIPVGGSTASLYYRGTKAGTTQLDASSNMTSSTTQPLVITAAAATKLAFLGPPQTKQAGISSDQIRIQLQDQFGNPTSSTSPINVSLNSSSSSGAFSLNTTPWQNITSLIIPINTQDAYVYYKDTTSGTQTLTAKANSLGDASQQFIVSSGDAVGLQFITPAQTLAAGQPSMPVTAMLVDQYGNSTLASQNTILHLTSTSTKGSFALNSDFSTPTSSPTIQAGTNNVSFFYKDTATGTPTITVSDINPIDIPDVGLRNASQTFTINTGTPHHLSLEAPSSFVAGTEVSASITVYNAYNVAVPVAQDTLIHLGTSSGSFTALGTTTPTISQITIPSGQSRVELTYRSSLAGSTTLSVRDQTETQPDSNLIDSSRTITVLPSTIKKLRFVSSSQTREAGEPSTPISVQTEDEFGNAVLVPADFTVYLHSSSAENSFSHDPDFATTTDTMTILAGTSIGRAYFRDMIPGTPTITASDAPYPDNPDTGLANDSQTETITTGTISRLAWKNVPAQLDAGQVSDAIKVETQNRWGAALPTTQDTTVYLSHSLSGNVFALNPSGPWDLKSVTIPNGQSSATLYYRSMSAGGDTLYISDSSPRVEPDTGLIDGSATLNTLPGTATHLVFSSPNQQVIARHTSQPFTVEIRNQYDAPVPASADTDIYLRSSSGTAEFATTSSGPWGENYVIIPSGSASASFYYHDMTKGPATLTASDNLPITPDIDLINAQQSTEITPQTVHHFYVTNIATPQTQGSPSSVVVEARDSEDYTVSDYAGTVSFTSSDADAVLPKSYTFIPETDRGIHTFGNNVAFLREGIKSVTATDTNGITGSQTGIVVNKSTAGPIAKVIFVNDPPISLISGKVSEALTMQLLDLNNIPSNAPDGGFKLRLTSDSFGGEYSLTPTGPWKSTLDVTVPAKLNSTNVYYRDTRVGTSTLTVKDWQAGFDEPAIANGTLTANIVGLGVDLTHKLEVNNNAHYYVPSNMIFARNDTGQYRARDSFTINVKDYATNTSVPSKLVMTLYNPDGSINNTQTIENVSTYTYTIDPITGTATEGSYRFEVNATSSDGKKTGSAFTKLDISGWSVAVNYEPIKRQVGEPVPFTISTKYNGIPADPANFSINFRDNNGENVLDGDTKTLGDMTPTAVGEYSGELATGNLKPTDAQFNNAYYLFARIFDSTSNQTYAEDNHYDLLFLNNPALAPKSFSIQKILTSTPPADETFDLKFTWATSEYASKYNLYRTQNKTARLYSDPCTIEQIRQGHRKGDAGATDPLCETTISQDVGTDDTTQWVKMAELGASDTTVTIPWSQVQNDLPNKTYYYLLRAENSRGESGFSTMAFSTKHIITNNTDPTLASLMWISIPSKSQYLKLSDIVSDIEGGTRTGNIINSVATWSSPVQRSNAYSFRAGRWLGNLNDIPVGTGVVLTPSAGVVDRTWTVVGTDDPVPMSLTFNTDGASNLNWLSMPYSTKYTKLSDVIKDIESNYAASPSSTIVSDVGIWSPSSQRISSRSYRSGRWLGTDLTINPGDGISVTLTNNTQNPGANWTIPLIINPNR